MLNHLPQVASAFSEHQGKQSEHSIADQAFAAPRKYFSIPERKGSLGSRHKTERSISSCSSTLVALIHRADGNEHSSDRCSGLNIVHLGNVMNSIGHYDLTLLPKTAKKRRPSTSSYSW